MEEYKKIARNELDKRQSTSIIFRDKYGFVVDYEEGNPTTLGEATLHTAIAAIAIATGNYSQDEWEKENGNLILAELLRTLLDEAWGNKDNLGRKHPIRHPDWLEYYGEDFRCRPLSRDSFGAIIAAIYYSYKCPNSNEEVRLLARQLATKWAEYLVLFQWRLHSQYIPGEFEQKEKNYRYIFSDKQKTQPAKFLGPGVFMLMPHEIYAFQNVASSIGIPSVLWNPWVNLTIEMKETLKDVVAPYVGGLAGLAVYELLEMLNISIPYEIPLGTDDWNLGKIKGSFDISISSDIRDKIVGTVKEGITDAIREIYRLETYTGHPQQVIDLHTLVLNRVINLLPEVLDKDTWRTVLTDALQKVLSWLNYGVLIETGTFLAALAIVSDEETSDISYTCWSVAVECETRVEIRELLRYAIKKFNEKIIEKDNQNGLWAWLAEDSEAVGEQLTLFESRNHRYWDKFAYGSTKYNEWAAEADKSESPRKSPRIDYLVIDGLLEKGTPPGIGEIVQNWYEKVMSIIQNLINKIIENIKNEFDKLGYYSREILNSAGELVRETWNKAMEYSIDLLKDGKIVDRKVFNKAGESISHWMEESGQIIEEYWNRATEKYWKGTWKKIGDKYEMIERQITSSDDIQQTLEHWHRESEKYWKGTWKKIGDKYEMIERQIISSNDIQQTLEHWHRESEKYWKGTWKKIGDKYEMIERQIISSDDIQQTLEHWHRESEKYWKGTWKKINDQYKMIERMKINYDASSIKEVWNEAGEWGESVFDKAGTLIKKSGIFNTSWIPELPTLDVPKISGPKLPTVNIPKIRW
ncbi:hypothetical protein [Bacillus sp. IBL03825]|uniref:hypothetical protein n=1 Tax=Bacillus sp. IBL03825 TaxID=2953580 RepID=UPI002158A037|nr:hypothetical protein [Bacillus sp. IBL03825]MCR6850378.1 hypothetical protein [Bacillus sp. IBL03825]